MLKNFLLIVAIFPFLSFAQSESISTEKVEEDKEEKLSYTYTKDRQFLMVTDFSNQIFVPKELEIGTNQAMNIPEGNISILFTNQSITFKGVDGYKKLSITSKQPWSMGYEFQWMDYRNPAINGILRVITDKKKFVELIYINGKKTPEYTFVLPKPNANKFEDEKIYFTRKSAINTNVYERLIGRKIKPYRVVNDVRDSRIEEKIDMKDESYIHFFDGKIIYKHGNLDKTYSIKKAKTYSYNNPSFPFAKSRIEITCKEIKEKVNIYLNSRKQIEMIEIRYTQFSLFPD